MSRKKMIVIAVILIIIGIGAYLVLQYIQKAKLAAAAGLPVAVEQCHRETIITNVTAKGEVSLTNSEKVYPNMAAEVEEVLVEKNDVVTKGQPLVRYKEKSLEKLQYDLKNAQLNIQNAEVSLQSAQIPPSEGEIEGARMDEADAERAISEINDAILRIDDQINRQNVKIADEKSNLSELEILHNAGAVSKSEITDQERLIRELELVLEDLVKDKAEKAQGLAKAEENLKYSQIRQKELLNTVNSQSRQSEITRLQINLEQMRLAAEQLQSEINNFQRELYAPIDGTIISLNVTKGQITLTDTPLMEIANLDEYVVKVDVKERNAAKIALGQDALIEGAVLGDASLAGKITKIGTIAEEKQSNNGIEKVVPVEITINQDQGKATGALKPGFSLDATITTDVRENVIAASILATLTENDGSNYVFVVKEGNILEKRLVKLGAFADMSVEILEGLSEEETIVSQPTMDLTDGMTIQVLDESAPAEETEGDAS